MSAERDVDGLGQAFGRQLHQSACDERAGNQSVVWMIPAAGVEIYRVEKAALDLVSQEDGEKKLGAGRAHPFRGRQACRDIVARMAGSAADIDIVDVVGANAC